MEYCPGRDLSRLTFTPIRFSCAWVSARACDKIFDAISRAGELLATFQGEGVIADGSESTAVMTRYHDLFEKNYRTHRPSLPQSILAAVRLNIRSTFNRCLVQRLVPEHHDFGPWNVTIGSQYWFLLDFGNFTLGCPEYDLAGFTVALELYSQHRTVKKGLIADLQVRFVESLCRSTGRDLSLDEELFRAFALMHLYDFARIRLHPQRKPSIWLWPSRDFFVNAFEDYLSGETASIRAVRCSDRPSSYPKQDLEMPLSPRRSIR